jgi:hypothetical protein
VDGLECTSVGGIGSNNNHRCLPTVLTTSNHSCIEHGMAMFQEAQQYDNNIMMEMQSQIWNAANMTPSQLVEQLLLSNIDDYDDGDEEDDYSPIIKFATSDAMKTVMRAIQNNDVAILQPVLQLLDVLGNCTATATSAAGVASNNNNNQSRSHWDDDARDGVVYAGIHVEAGLLGQVSFDIIATGWPVTNDYEATFVRVCAGLELGGGADVSFLVGKAMGSATVEDLPSIGLLAGIDAHAIVGMGIDVGILQNGQEVIQVMAGVGAGIGAALQMCGTVKVSDSIL